MSEAHIHHETPSIPFEDLPARMKRARERTGLHQAQIGAILGVHQRTVANYEGGNTEPKIEILRRWAEITNVPVDWLILGVEQCPHCHSSLDVTETRSRCVAENTLVSGLDGEDIAASNVVYADFDAVRKGLDEHDYATDGSNVIELPQHIS